MVDKVEARADGRSGILLRAPFKKMTIPSITNTERTWQRWHVWCPPIEEDNPGQPSLSEIDLNAHLIRMWSGDNILCKCVEHEIQVGPGEVPEKGRYYADGAKLTDLMVVVITIRKVSVRMEFSIWSYGDENVFEEGGYLP